MTPLPIDGIRFEFDDSWSVAKWDDSRWYSEGIKKLKGRLDGRPEGTKAVDALGGREGIPYLFEVKDFRGFAIENKQRQLAELPLEVGLKARDTVAGLLGWIALGKQDELPLCWVRAVQKRHVPVHVIAWIAEDSSRPGESSHKRDARDLARASRVEGAHALHYTSRIGISWFLHQGATKTGRPKYYVAKSIGPGAIAAMPAGFEFSESVNGVVSVRRVNSRPTPVDDADVELVLREVARHPHLRYHRVAAGRAEIVIHEPIGALSDSGFQRLASMFGHLRSWPESHLSEIRGRARYTPVLKFIAETAVGGPSEPRTYSVRRMTYRGDGGWSYPLADGPLRNLVWRIGTDRFFDL